MKRRWPWVTGALALVVGMALAAGAAAVRQALSPRAATAPEVIFNVTPGQSLGAIAANLEREGLVRDATALEWLARYRGLAGALHAGEYWLSAALSCDEILDHLTSGKVATYAVVIPEGFRLIQIAERLEAAGLAKANDFTDVASDPEVVRQLGVEGETLEGYLFPETYHLPHGLSAREVAGVLVAQFKRVWREIEPLAKKQELTMRAVVTLASIVEKETGAASERPLIASVFRNRMKRGMRLETDPTVIYGIPDFDGNLRRRDLENADNVYNTYVIRGLPPGPIASPGAESLRAVVEPAQSDYLFFVSRNDGTHIFSKSYREHAAAVDRYQRRRSR